MKSKIKEIILNDKDENIIVDNNSINYEVYKINNDFSKVNKFIGENYPTYQEHNFDNYIKEAKDLLNKFIKHDLSKYKDSIFYKSLLKKAIKYSSKRYKSSVQMRVNVEKHVKLFENVNKVLDDFDISKLAGLNVDIINFNNN